MSARPALALVTTPPGPGRSALAFIQWAVDTFGQPGPQPGQVVVRHSQRALAAMHETIRSDGTVTRYMGQLRAAGIVTGTRPIAVDLDALADIAGDVPCSPDRLCDPISADGDSQAELAGPTSLKVAQLIARRAEQQARLAQLQAELALTDVAIARALDDTEPAGTDLAARDLAIRPLANRDRFREFRDAEVAIQEGRKDDLDNPPSFLTSDVASREREPRESSRCAGPLPAAEPALTYVEIDEILEPLRTWCRATGRTDHLDDKGRGYLAPLGRSRLTAGAARIHIEAENDPGIRKPIGLLVARARSGHADTFHAPPQLELSLWATPLTGPTAKRSRVEPLFEPPMGHPLDRDVVALAASPSGLPDARRSLRTAPTTRAPRSDQETHSWSRRNDGPPREATQPDLHREEASRKKPEPPRSAGLNVTPRRDDAVNER